MEAINNPENENDGSRKIPFTKELFIERDDFMENPPRKYFRMTPGKEVRLKHAYYLMCESVVKDENDNVVEIHCTYDPATKGGWSDDGRKVKGTLHWVSSKYAINAELRIYDHLFLSQNPEENGNYLDNINPNSLSVNREAKLEPSLKEAKAGDYFQFLRKGYFCLDSKDSSKSNLVFNKTVGLRDSWSKKHK